MASTPHSIGPVKDYDPRTASIVIGGTNLEDLQEFGWNMDKSHDLNYTVDNNAVYVHVPPELTGTGVVYQTSPSIGPIIQSWVNEESIAVSFNAAEDSGYSGVTFTDCKVQSVDRSNTTIDGVPTSTFDIVGADMQ